MTDDVLDPIAEAAVRELADQLSVTLTETVDGAATAALKRVEHELELRVGQIDSATSRVVDLIDTIGDEMQTRAVAALAEGVRTEVMPVLARDEEKFRDVVKEMSKRVVERTESADHAIQKAISDTRAAVLRAADALSTQIAAANAEQARNAERIADDLRKQNDAIAMRLEMRLRKLFRLEIAVAVMTAMALLLIMFHLY